MCLETCVLGDAGPYRVDNINYCYQLCFLLDLCGCLFFFLINLGKDLEILFPLFKAQISLPFAIFVFTFYFGIFFFNFGWVCLCFSKSLRFLLFETFFLNYIFWYKCFSRLILLYHIDFDILL